jgi:hypothetical protein
METTQGLHELIRSRLIEKRGNVKLTENTDIILYGKALGINENQLLFKILEIEETIDWAKEKANVNQSETYTASTSTNVIYCSSCHAANETGIANFCVDCGAAFKREPVKAQEQFVAPPGIPKKSKIPYILGAIALLVIIILGVLLYVKNKERDKIPKEITAEEALNLLSQYYEDLNNSSMDANNYFAENVSDFISRHNVSPKEINQILSQNNEYVNGESAIKNDEVTYQRKEDNISYYRYWIDYHCYRKSKNKNEFCKVNIEVGFNENNQITSYKQLKVSDLRFEELQPSPEKLIAGKWKIEDFKTNQPIPAGMEEVFKQMMDQMKANSSFEFKADKTVIATMSGVASNGTWSVDKEGKKLTMTDNQSKKPSDANIEELTDKKLVLKMEDGGQAMTLTLVHTN